jgi:hypothetical protein
MGDEKEKEKESQKQNQDPTDELSKEDLEKVHGGGKQSWIEIQSPSFPL